MAPVTMMCSAIVPTAGHRLADSGRVLLSNGMDIGYLEQTSVSGSDLTVWDEARSRMTALVEAEAALEKASIAASEGHPKGKRLLLFIVPTLVAISACFAWRRLHW